MFSRRSDQPDQPDQPGNPDQGQHPRTPPVAEPAWYERDDTPRQPSTPGGEPLPGGPWPAQGQWHAAAQPDPAWYDRGDPAPEDDDEADRERFHPAFMLMTMVRSIRGFIFPIAIALFSGSRGEFIWLGIAGAFAALTVLNAVATWWMSSYQVTGTSLRLRTGWLNRQERSVSFERIQTIDLQEPPLARALGVAQLRVETAAGGGNKADIVIEAIAARDATALRNELLAERARHTSRRGDANPTAGPITAAGQALADPITGSADPATASLEPGQVIGRLSRRDLLIAGMTSGRIGPAAAILAAVSQFGGDLLQNVGRGILGSRFDEILDWGTSAPVQGILLVVFVLGLGAWALSILGTVLSFSGFTLRRDDDQLLVSTGLLDRRRTTIPLHRIQSITVKEGLLRQPFGLVSVHFVSAGYGGGQQNPDSGILFPLIRRSDVAALLAEAVPAFSADIEAVRTAGRRLPQRALPRYVVPAIAWDLVGLAIALLVAWRLPFTEWWWGFAAILIFSTPWSWLSYRDTRWEWDPEDRLIVQGRSVARSVTIIPRRRVQNREIRQNWFQRRADLATLAVRVAGSTFGNSVTIAHMDAGDATDLAGNLALHDVPRRQPGGRRSSPVSDSTTTPAAVPDALIP
ncbi:MAG TPA: PH domain-containing protein [Thermomicrobiales bacterium]|jgi:putative membrane protein|nr:PH domain-containing protein [Thermomicrobiales bacterium]